MPYQLQRSPPVTAELDELFAASEEELRATDDGVEERELAVLEVVVFNPKKRIASAALTGRLCPVPCKLIASTGAWSPPLP